MASTALLPLITVGLVSMYMILYTDLLFISLTIELLRCIWAYLIWLLYIQLDKIPYNNGKKETIAVFQKHECISWEKFEHKKPDTEEYALHESIYLKLKKKKY